MNDVTKFLTQAKTYIGKNGNYVCNTKLHLGAVYDWCAFSISAIMNDCGFIGKYIKQIEGGAGSIPRESDGKYGTWFRKGVKTPQPGDLILFRYGGSYSDKYHSDHIGIVEAVSGNTITTLEGNVDGNNANWAATSTFKRKTRYLSDSSVYAFYRPNWVPDKTTSSGASGSKSVDTLAKEVIAGKWGSGDERKRRLTAEGYSYTAVQNRVNDILLGRSIRVGDRVRVKHGTKSYGTNIDLSSFVYTRTFTAMEISGNRAVIGLNGQVTAAVDKRNLTIA